MEGVEGEEGNGIGGIRVEESTAGSIRDHGKRLPEF